MRRRHLVGVAVAAYRGDRQIYANGFGFADLRTERRVAASTVFRYGSLTKSYTAAAVLSLVRQHALNLNDPVTRFFPSLVNLRAVTVADLLEHRSGLPQSRDRSEFSYGSAGISHSAALLARLSRLRLTGPPGRRWDYNNLNYLVLGMVVERVSHRTYEQYLRTALLEPLALRSISIRADDANGVARGYDCSHSTPREMPLEREFPFSAGGLSGDVVDATTWYAALAFGSLHARIGAELFTPRAAIGHDRYYGYGQFVDRSPEARVWHTGFVGGFSAAELIAPGRRLSVVVLSNCSHYDAMPLAAALLDVFTLTPSR